MVDCVLLVCACVMLYGWSDLVFVRHWHSILYWFTTPPMSVVTHFTSSVFCFHRSTVCVRVSRAVIAYLQKWIVEVQKGTVKYHYWRKTKDCSLLLKWQSEFLLNRIVIHTYTIHWPLINGRWESQFRLEARLALITVLKRILTVKCSHCAWMPDPLTWTIDRSASEPAIWCDWCSLVWWKWLVAVMNLDTWSGVLRLEHSTPESELCGRHVQQLLWFGLRKP